MGKRLSAMEDQLTNKFVGQIVQARFEEETAQMLKVLDGNVSGPTLRHVAQVIERYKAERWPESRAKNIQKGTP
jgi:post-segregation antitoxin (ccd killing protein)